MESNSTCAYFSNGWEKTPIRSSITECDKGLWSLLSPFLQVKRVLGRMEVQLKSGCGFFWDAGSYKTGNVLRFETIFSDFTIYLESILYFLWSDTFISWRIFGSIIYGRGFQMTPGRSASHILSLYFGTYISSKDSRYQPFTARKAGLLWESLWILIILAY